MIGYSTNLGVCLFLFFIEMATLCNIFTFNFGIQFFVYLISMSCVSLY